MKYLKLKTLGTESVIAPPLNPHHVKNFDTAMQVQDIFKDYTAHMPIKRRVRNGKRPVKRKPLFTKEEYKVMPKRIFGSAIKLIILGIVQGKFQLKLPAGRGYMYLRDVDNKLSYYKRYGLDPLDQQKKAYRIEFKYNTKNKDYITRVFLSKKYRDMIHEGLSNDTLKLTSKEVTLYQIAKRIHKLKYPKLDILTVYHIILHGFKYICKGIVNKIDTIVFNTYGKSKGVDQIFFKPSTDGIDRITQYNNKIRFLYAMDPVKYSGYYYGRMSHESFNNFTKKPVDLKLFLHLEEALTEPLIYPHIFKIKVQKPLFKKLNIYREITYEKNNTKYVWRWNGKGFESVDNSKLRFD